MSNGNEDGRPPMRNLLSLAGLAVEQGAAGPDAKDWEWDAIECGCAFHILAPG